MSYSPYSIEERFSMITDCLQSGLTMYDIGDGLTLMNVINKNETGKMHQVTT